MKYTSLTVYTLVAALLFSVASTQLLSCADVNCTSPSDHISCHSNGRNLLSIGVSEYTSNTLNTTLSWTSGLSMGTRTKLNAPIEWVRTFYLGQPPSTDLRNDLSLSACALFFYEITPHLRFDYSNPGLVNSNSNGTCADALTAQCVSDWTQQARAFAEESGSVFNCSDMAERIAKKPPSTCKIAQKSWGKVVAKDISGTMMPTPVQQESCSITINRTYSATEIFQYNSTKTEDVYAGITPVLTIFGRQNTGSEVHLSCLKPIDHDNESGFQGGSRRVEKSGTMYALSLLLAGLWMIL